MTLIRRIARPLLASTFFVGAANALQKSEPLSEKAQPVTDPIVEKLRSAAPQVTAWAATMLEKPKTSCDIAQNAAHSARVGNAAGSAAASR